MVKTSHQIEQELARLQLRTQEIEKSLEPLYKGYLQALAKSSQRQFMAAVYHLCTQAYPDKFVALKLSRRNQLQVELQEITARLPEALQKLKEGARKQCRQPQQQRNGLMFLQRLLEARGDSTIIHSPAGDEDDLRQMLSDLAQSASKRSSSDTSTNDQIERSTSDERIVDAITPENTDSNSTDSDSIESDDFSSSGTDSNSDNFDSSDLDNAEMYEAMLAEAEAAEQEQSETSSPSEEDPLEAFLSDSAADEPGENPTEDDFDYEMEVPAAEQRLTLNEEDDLLSALEGLARRSLAQGEEDTAEPEQPLTPMHLVRQQVLVEKGIRDLFSTLSDEANELLQNADVMPNFPKALMAAATDARGAGDAHNSVPNIVTVSVRVMHGEAVFEPDDDGEEKEEGKRYSKEIDAPSRSNRGPKRDRAESESNGRRDEHRRRRRRSMPRRMMTRDIVEIDALPEFSALNLQLSEVEFSDPTVSVWQNRLRKELSSLKQLGRRYKKTQRALETAQAEDAWRASWTKLPKQDEAEE